MATGQDTSLPGCCKPGLANRKLPAGVQVSHPGKLPVGAAAELPGGRGCVCHGSPTGPTGSVLQEQDNRHWNQGKKPFPPAVTTSPTPQCLLQVNFPICDRWQEKYLQGPAPTSPSRAKKDGLGTPCALLAGAKPSAGGTQDT